MEFQSRAVRNLVDLHEREMRAFLELWARFNEAGVPLPDADGDPDYESRERLIGHVLMAARGYLTRTCEWVGRPATDLDASQDPLDVAKRAPEFIEGVLAGYRHHLAPVTKDELEPQVHRTRLGALLSVEMLLEHAVVHPMRHRIQLERLLESRASLKA